MTRGLVTSFVVLLALAAAPSIGAQTPGTLSGSILNGEANPSLGIGAVAVDCEPAGTSIVDYHVVGAALGPYPGTYEETGRFTIANGQVTAFEADFTIDSGLADIVGSKSLRTSTSAVCLDAPEDGIAAFADVAVNASYEAVVTTPVGTFTDEGRSVSGAQMLTTPDGRASAAAQSSLVSEAPVLIPTAGHVTGGGYVGDVLNDWVSFGFSAKSDGATVRAQCNVGDRSRSVDVKCLDSTLLALTATHATFVGTARVNGELMDYRIDVDDLGAGAGSDTFRIQTGNGFTAAGILAGGNVRIHD